MKSGQSSPRSRGQRSAARNFVTVSSGSVFHDIMMGPGPVLPDVLVSNRDTRFTSAFCQWPRPGNRGFWVQVGLHDSARGPRCRGVA